MTRPPQRLQDSVTITRVSPKVATALLIKGLLPEDDAESFKPTNLTAEAIVKLLFRANEVRNRTVSLPAVYKLSRDMTEGNWLWTGEPIQLDPDGFVRNGQHRLLAVVHSRTTQDFVIVNNVPVESQLVMDIGRPRSAANQMHLVGVSSATISTAIANVLLRWRNGRIMLSSYVPSVMEIHQLIQAEEELNDALTLIYRVRRNVNRAPLSALGAAFIEGGHVDVDARNEFFNSLVTGANLAVDDPILVLRTAMGRQLSHSVRGRRVGQLYQIVHAWNLWRKHQTARLLRVPSTLTSENFPKMI